MWLGLGSAASALQLFEELDMWENVIDCYIVRDTPPDHPSPDTHPGQIQERLQAAEELLRKLLDEKPSPKLWGLLGDLTREV